MNKYFVHVRGVVVSVACLVIGIFHLLPYLPQWAWITLGGVGLVVDVAYYVMQRRRERTTPGEASANGEAAS
ncbi:MAG: hypothetical protein JWR11_2788 [Mycobacterium sp.]|jgi:hypothetical protein|nr:hypothetical protein [Mycobacterium sp.]MDT5064249.1 hypothetical protein [Mycobacterium sp.]MDT5176981.1 hypothetical protein [Mycobacterium sp.]